MESALSVALKKQEGVDNSTLTITTQQKLLEEFFVIGAISH
jgi:hypothetical protein